MNRVKLSRYWAFQLLGWGTFAFVNSFFAYTFGHLADEEAIKLFFGRMGMFMALGLVGTHIMRFVIIRLNILQKSFEKQIFQFLFLTICFSIIASYFYAQILHQFNWLFNNEVGIMEVNFVLLVLQHTFNAFIYFFIWNLIYFMYHYVSKSRRQQMDTLQLESLVKELELKTIKAHINPHFIFNALNSIRALIDEDPGRARRAVTELSNILRSSLKAEKGETVSFKDELKIVKDYLALENMRFEDRLQVEYDIDEDTLDQQVPPMMLQTLVENAIKHGISRQVAGGVVRVISDFKSDYHLLAVQNTGQLAGASTQGGFGLSSTKDRLSLLYGSKARFEIRQVAPTLVEAKVLIPVTINQHVYN